MNALILPVKRLTLPVFDQRILESWNCEEVVVKPYKKDVDRTLKQNSLLWALYTDIEAALEFQFTTEEIHEFCKKKFLPRAYKTVLGEEVQIPKSTRDLTTKDFSVYIERIIAFFAIEHGIELSLKEDATH